MGTIISNSAAETIAAGRTFGERARAGEVFALVGDLGTGKTQFVKGFVGGLASDAEVTSPTFVLVHEYRDGRLPVFHLDFYRLGDRDGILQLGLDDYFFGNGVSLIEWADRFPDMIPRGARWLSFTVTGENSRAITEEQRQ